MSKDKYIEGFKGLAIYQISGGAISLASAVYVAFLLAQAGIFPVFLTIVPILFFSFSVYCGIALLQHKSGSIELSLVNQYLQLVSLSSGGFVYKYVAGISMDVLFNARTAPLPRINLTFFTFNLYINVESEVREFAINIIAAGIIIILHQELRAIAKDKIRDQIDSIGS